MCSNLGQIGLWCIGKDMTYLYRLNSSPIMHFVCVLIMCACMYNPTDQHFSKILFFRQQEERTKCVRRCSLIGS